MSNLDRRIAPPSRPFGRLSIPDERIVRFSNGTRLHIVADESCPLSRLSIVGAGGKNESADHALAISSAHMLSEGSADFDVETTADMIDFCGGTISSRCSDHFTRLELTVLSPYLPELLPVVYGLITAPEFPDYRLEAAKTYLSAQCAYDNSRVDNIAWEAAFALLAGELHPLSQFPHPDDFSTIDSSQIHRRLSEIFRSGGIDVFLSGGADDSTVDAVGHMIEKMTPGPAIEKKTVPFKAEMPQTVHIEHPGAEQCAVQVMIPAISRSHPDYIPLRLAVTALGGFFGSRLMQNIREDKGLTYGISASLCGTQEGSYIDIAAQCAPQYTIQLIDELRTELKNMSCVPLSGDELLRMRLYEQTRLASVLDNAIAIGEHYLTALTIGLPVDYFQQQEHITATITAGKIAEISERYLNPESMRIAIVGAQE